MGLLLLESPPSCHLNFSDDIRLVTIPSQIAETLLDAARSGLLARARKEASRASSASGDSPPENIMLSVAAGNVGLIDDEAPTQRQEEEA